LLCVFAFINFYLLLISCFVLVGEVLSFMSKYACVSVESAALVDVFLLKNEGVREYLKRK